MVSCLLKIKNSNSPYSIIHLLVGNQRFSPCSHPRPDLIETPPLPSQQTSPPVIQTPPMICHGLTLPSHPPMPSLVFPLELERHRCSEYPSGLCILRYFSFLLETPVDNKNTQVPGQMFNTRWKVARRLSRALGRSQKRAATAAAVRTQRPRLCCSSGAERCHSNFSSPSSTSFRLSTSREPLPLVSFFISSSISLKQPGSMRHTCNDECSWFPRGG